MNPMAVDREHPKPVLSFSSEGLLQQAFAKLLTMMPRISNVRILQGGEERGKDIVFTSSGGLGEQVHCACVVKNRKITGKVGSTGGARTVLQQIEQALDTPYLDEHGNRISIERVYVISPFDITPQSLESVGGKLQRLSGSIRFITGHQLFQLFKNYWPDFLLEESLAIERYLAELRRRLGNSSHLDTVATMYQLGPVTEHDKHIYVPLCFEYILRSFIPGRKLTDSLPPEQPIHKGLNRTQLDTVLAELADLQRFVTHVTEWGHWTHVANSAIGPIRTKKRKNFKSGRLEIGCRKVHERLLKLHEHGYISRITLPLQKHIYTAAKKGIGVLVAHGVAPCEIAERRLRHHELKPMFLEHALMVTDIHVRLLVDSPSDGKRLVAWKEGQSLWDSVEIMNNGRYEEVPIRPDGFFTIEDTKRPAGQNRAHFFLEADRSTTSHERFRKKLAGYWEYLVSGRYTKRYGFRTFRVATITVTDERALNLCQLAHDTLPENAHRHFLFSSIGKISAGIFSDVFLGPDDCGSSVRHRLVPEVSLPALAP